MAGAAIGLLRLAVGLLWAAWIRRRATPIRDAEWLLAAEAAASALMLTRPVPLGMSDRTAIPATCGLLRPALLVPPEGLTWTVRRRRAVLLHELAHVKRGDCLLQAVAHFALAVYWWHPLAWLAIAGLRAEQERACDDLVLTAGLTGPEYADHLCAIAQHSRAMAFPTWTTLAMARSSKLEMRVRAILDDTCDRRAPSPRLAAAMTTAACACLVLLGAMHLSAAAVPVANVRAAAGSAEDGRDRASIPARSLHLPSEVVAVTPAIHESQAAASEVRRTQDESRALLNDFCVTCHNTTRRTANLALDALTLNDVGGAAETLERMVKKMRSGMHPPSGAPRPDALRANAFISTVEAALDRADLANWAPGSAGRLTQSELAARLATFLWSAEPDQELMDLSRRGRLSNPSVLTDQTRRMLTDPRSSAWLRGFFGRWLYLRNIDQVKPDPALFPAFDDSLRAALRRETELFVESQVREDRSVTDLLTADYTFVNERLARHYGIPNIVGPEFQRVTVRDQARTGLLGQASILTVTSYANRTSPVLRGKFILEIFLGTPPPPPPPNVPALKENDPQLPQPLRRRMEEFVKAPACGSCHRVMDPIGFAFENFDAIGQWRDTDAGLPIDASGTLSDDTPFTGPADFKLALLQRRDALVHTITERLLAYALTGDIKPGSIRHFHMPAVRAIVADSTVDRHRWSAIVSGIVRSTPFQMRRLD
jgi:hypothetical protein